MDIKYENVKIVLKNNIPSGVVENVVVEDMTEKILVRILFTLIDTTRRLDYFNCLDNGDSIPYHYGYTSVGVIEEVGEGIKSFEKGMTVILPAVYSKYLLISSEYLMNMRDKLFFILPFNLDKVKALFFPMFCVCNPIYENIVETNSKVTVFWGCGLTGAILLKTLNKVNIHPYVYIGDYELKAEAIEQNGGKLIKEDFSQFIDTLLNQKQVEVKIVCFNNDLNSLNLGQNLNIELINVEEYINKEYDGLIWLSRYIKNNVIDMLLNEKIEIGELIGQHIHAEAAPKVCEHIKNNIYNGRALVYDW